VFLAAHALHLSAQATLGRVVRATGVLAAAWLIVDARLTGLFTRHPVTDATIALGASAQGPVFAIAVLVANVFRTVVLVVAARSAVSVAALTTLTAEATFGISLFVLVEAQDSVTAAE
jgi:hypothetical protein